MPLLPKVPVTRIYDATPLDVVGLPIFSAVTPLARDLTVHAGKGSCAEASRLSAAMEAVDRCCAESLPPARLRRASYQQLCTGCGYGYKTWPTPPASRSTRNLDSLLTASVSGALYTDPTTT
ncbi:MAG: hypothetical protein WCC47_09150 [Pseudonocardiaceae bacterium]